MESESYRQTEPGALMSACPVSGSTNIVPFLEIEDVPVFCNVLHDSRESALSAQTASMAMAHCPDSGHVFNAAFNPELVRYAPGYENALHYSPTFNRFAEELASKLVATFDLRDSLIIDIGCGDGTFLAQLCEMSASQGIGFDPSFNAGGTESLPRGVTVIPDTFPRGNERLPGDLVVCRHVLEHVARPDQFLSDILRGLDLKKGVGFYFEVPNVRNTIENLAVWDLIYEHFSYFSCESLVHLFRRQGLTVMEAQTAFGGQYLSVKARTSLKGRKEGNSICGITSDLTRSILDFPERYRNKTGYWARVFDEIVERSEKAVLWGGGSKGTTILNLLGIKTGVQYVVDVNPRKKGKFVGGTGQEIVAPGFLSEYRPDKVIVLNELYLDEIRKMMFDMGLSPELIAA